MAFQKPLGVDRRHAAGARRGDGLAIDMILDVAACKDTRDFGFRPVMSDNVSVGIQIQLSDEEFGIRLVADGDE